MAYNGENEYEGAVFFKKELHGQKEMDWVTEQKLSRYLSLIVGRLTSNYVNLELD